MKSATLKALEPGIVTAIRNAITLNKINGFSRFNLVGLRVELVGMYLGHSEWRVVIVKTQKEKYVGNTVYFHYTGNMTTVVK